MTETPLSERPLAVVVLAAGMGTRMVSDRPKVLHEIAGAPMLHHALRAALTLEPERLAVVVGRGAEAVGSAARAVMPEVRLCLQVEQKGTGHAVLSAAEALDGFEGDLAVLFGDTPFIRPATLSRMMETRRAGADLVALGFEAAAPGRYGRLVLDPAGDLERIVEAKDATAAELAVTTCNSGVMTGDANIMLRLLAACGTDNAQGEVYLTDIVSLARAQGLRTRAVLCDESETLGVNDRVQLAAAEAAFQGRARAAAMEAGVTFTAPETVFLSHDTDRKSVV